MCVYFYVSIFKVLGTEASLPTTTGTATSFSEARRVRLVNLSGATRLITVVETQSGTVVGSFTLPPITSGAEGGIEVIVKDLLDAGLLNGNTMTCTGETLYKQLTRLKPKQPDGKVIYSVKKPFVFL